MVVVVACKIIVSAPVQVPFLWTLDLGFGPWIMDLDFGLGFWTGLGLDNFCSFFVYCLTYVIDLDMTQNLLYYCMKL